MRRKVVESTNKLTVYGFPSDPVKRQLWINALPNKFPNGVIKNMGVCQFHWPHDAPKEKPRQSRALFNFAEILFS